MVFTLKAANAETSAIEEPTVDQECSIYDPSSSINFDHGNILTSELLDPDCEAVLETMDSCVGCVEGVGEQHVYEERMKEHARERKVAVEQHGLSEAEAAMIRLHIMEERDDTKQVNETAIVPDLDILNFCGNDDDLDDAQASFVISTTNQAMSCADIVDEDLLVPRKDTAVRNGVGGKDLHPFQCAICFDQALQGNISLNRVKFANLPCCGGTKQEGNASFIKVCTSCILVLTSPSSKGQHRIGRCPRCLKWIKVQIPESTDNKQVVLIEKVDKEGQCLICNQHKDHLVDEEQVCDSCFLGRRQPLKYECQQCHSIQKIPHPMYRYQDKEEEFGNVTWACQGKCGGFTKWKILPEDLHRIPLGDAPRSWGKDYISIARSRVKILREDLVSDKNTPSQAPFDEDPSQCTLL